MTTFFFRKPGFCGNRILDEPYDCEINSSEWRKWEERLDRLTRMMDTVHEILDDGKCDEKDETDDVE